MTAIPMKIDTMHGCVSTFFTTSRPSTAVNIDKPYDHMKIRCGSRKIEAYSSPSEP